MFIAVSEIVCQDCFEGVFSPHPESASLFAGKAPRRRPYGGGNKETFHALPVLFWRVSLAALSSRKLGERPGEQGEPGVRPGKLPIPTGISSPETIPGFA